MNDKNIPGVFGLFNVMFGLFVWAIHLGLAGGSSNSVFHICRPSQHAPNICGAHSAKFFNYFDFAKHAPNIQQTLFGTRSA